MIFRRLRLLQHLEALRHFYLFYAGDILSLFMQSIFNDDFDSSLKESSLGFLNNQFEIAVKLSLPNFNTDKSENIGEQAAQEFQKVFGFH
jgi:Gamma tubulin complex component C-terminal